MSVNSRLERLDENAWIEAAMDLLVSGSVDSIGVEPLAKHLGVTKGSFYWHFKDRAALLQAVLRTWQQRATLAIIDRVEHSNKGPKERLRQIIELPYTSPRARRGALVELAIRGWARRDNMAATAVAEVDELRLRYSAMLYRSAGLDEEAARARAFLTYSYNLGEAMINSGETEDGKHARRLLCADILLEGDKN